MTGGKPESLDGRGREPDQSQSLEIPSESLAETEKFHRFRLAHLANLAKIQRDQLVTFGANLGQGVVENLEVPFVNATPDMQNR